jgi:hypothetical protein
MKPEYEQFSDYRKAEHFAWYCNFHGIRQRQKASAGILDFLGADTESDREKELLKRYEKYGPSWRLQSNPAFWEYRLREDLLQWAQEGRHRAVWWKLAQQEGNGGPERRAELEAFLRENDAMPELSQADAEWIADQKARYPSFYGLEV